MEKGRYNLGNDNLIHVENTVHENKLITNHEEVHKYLCGYTSYGLALIILKKNDYIDSSYNWILNYFEQNMIRMQEQIATFVEYISVYIEDGKEEYIFRLNELKANKRYFNYYRKLLYSDIKLDDQLNAEELKRTIVALGLLSLNINLDTIPFEEFKDEKDIQRFLTKDGNIVFLPNRRFEILFDYFYRNNQELEDTVKNIIDNSIETEDNEGIIQSARNAVERLYKSSPIYNNLMIRANTISINEMVVSESVDPRLLSAFPMDMSLKNQKKYNINFINLVELLKTYHRLKNEDIVIRFEHLIAGYEDFALVTLWDLKNEKTYSSRYPIELFDAVIKDFNVPVVFIQKKLFRQKKQKIKGLVKQLPIYLYMDGAMVNSLEFIKKNFKGGKFLIIEKENNYAVVIFRGAYVLIQPIVNELAECLEVFLNDEFGIRLHEDTEMDMNISLLKDIILQSAKFSKHSFNTLEAFN